MFWFDTPLLTAQAFLLFLLRASGFILVAPFFSFKAIPMQFRGTFAAMLAIIMASLNSKLAPVVMLDLNQFIIYAIHEVLIGTFMGFCLGLLFVVIEFAGSMMGFQIGFGIINVLNPQTNEQNPIISSYLFIVVFLLTLSLRLHHAFLMVWVRSYEIVPVGSGVINPNDYVIIGKLAMNIFYLSLQLALPIMITLFLLDFILGIMARTMPTLNVFLVGLPLKVIIGLVFIGVVVTLLPQVLKPMGNTFIDLTAASLNIISKAKP